MTPDQTRKHFAKLVKNAGGASAVALRVGCSVDMIALLIKGTRTPGMKLARAIQELYKIPMADWLDAPRIETVEKIA